MRKELPVEVGDLQADALTDLKTTTNELTVWHVKEDKSNLDEIVTALQVDNDVLDYVLVEIHILTKLDLSIEEKSEGISNNILRPWLRVIPNLSAAKLLELAMEIQAKVERV